MKYMFSDFLDANGVLTIPEYVHSIPSDAWIGITESVVAIRIPNTVTIIEDYAFSGCENLLSVEFYDVEENTQEESEFNLLNIINGYSTTDSDNSEQSCQLKNIGNYSFCDCKALKSIILPNSLERIGEGAFQGCSSLESIVIPENVSEIGDFVFSCCINLRTISVAAENIFFKESNNCCISSDGKKLLFGRSKSEIPDGVEEICPGAFFSNMFLERVKIPASVQIIGEGAFDDCPNILGVEVSPFNNNYVSESDCCLTIDRKVLVFGCQSSIVPEGVEIIGHEAFSGCTGLSKVELPNSVSIVEEYAFWNCSNLKEVSMIGNIVEIGNGAFGSCKSLSSITLPRTLSVIGESAFVETGITSIEISRDVKSIGNSAFSECESLESIHVDNENDTFISLDNCCLSHDGQKLIFGCKSSIIPPGVKVICKSAFEFCYGLTEILIPEGVEEIEEDAFGGCENLSNVKFPTSLKIIGSTAFSYCENLSAALIPQNVHIEEDAFRGCDKLTIINKE